MAEDTPWNTPWKLHPNRIGLGVLVRSSFPEKSPLWGSVSTRIVPRGSVRVRSRG